MNSATFEDLAEHFGSKLEAIKLSVDLRDCAGDDTCQPIVFSIQSELHKLGGIMALMRGEIAKQKDQLKSAEDLKKAILNLNAQLKYSLDNIPARLPKKQEPAMAASCPAPADEVPNTTRKRVESGSSQVPSQSQSGATAAPAPTQAKAKPSFYVQEVEYLTIGEFDLIPKYMKGRLNYDQVNTVVDELNKAYAAKYKLLRQKRIKLKNPDQKLWEVLKSQENKDTKGHYFIVDDDVKRYTSLKVDSSFRNMMTILRHCGRIKEIRGGGFTRYSIMLVY